MEILLRKIQRKKDSFIFKPYSKGGFRFTEDLAQPSLTPFQASCIISETKKDKKLGSFSTPEFCYLGSLMVSDKSLNLKDVFIKERLEIEESFNSYFPEKKWYWYSKTEPHNLAVQTYFVGVRVVANIVAYYFQLQKTGQILEADSFYKNLIKPSGIERVLANSNSSLITKDDFLYRIELDEMNCVVTTKSVFDEDIKEHKSYEENEVVLKTNKNRVTNKKAEALVKQPREQAQQTKQMSVTDEMQDEEQPIHATRKDPPVKPTELPEKPIEKSSSTPIPQDLKTGFRQRSEEELRQIRNARIPKIASSNDGKNNNDGDLGRTNKKVPKLPKFGDGDL